MRLWSLWFALGFFGMYLLVFPFQALFLNIKAPWGHRVAHALNIYWGAWLFLWGWCVVVKKKSAPLPRGTYVFVSNHRSYIDIPAAHVTFCRFFRFIAKEELTRVPLFGYMYKKLHIMLDRSSPMARARSLQVAAQALRRGESLFIFPEGTTRHEDPRVLGAFQEGAFTLAVREKTPIVPVALIGTRRMLSADGSFGMRPFQKIRAIVHSPIPTNHLTLDDVPALSAQVRGWIQQQMDAYENR